MRVKIKDWFVKNVCLHVCCRERGTFQEINWTNWVGTKICVYNFVVELSEIEAIYFLMMCWKIVKLGNWCCRYVLYIVFVKACKNQDFKSKVRLGSNL